MLAAKFNGYGDKLADNSKNNGPVIADKRNRRLDMIEHRAPVSDTQDYSCHFKPIRQKLS